jgi:hypothetical protein
LLIPKPAAKYKSAIKEFEFGSVRTTKQTHLGNNMGKIIETL